MNDYHHDTAIFDQERDEVYRLAQESMVALANVLAQTHLKVANEMKEIPVMKPIDRPLYELNPELWNE